MLFLVLVIYQLGLYYIGAVCLLVETVPQFSSVVTLFLKYPYFVISSYLFLYSIRDNRLVKYSVAMRLIYIFHRHINSVYSHE